MIIYLSVNGVTTCVIRLKTTDNRIVMLTITMTYVSMHYNSIVAFRQAYQKHGTQSHSTPQNMNKWEMRQTTARTKATLAIPMV